MKKLMSGGIEVRYVTALVIALLFSNQASAGIIAVGGPVSNLGSAASVIAPPAFALDAMVTNTGQQGFDEQLGVLLPAALAVDAGSIAAGTVVDSHMIFLNKPATIGGVLLHSSVTWTFSGNVLGVMSDSGGTLEAASTALLGAPGTSYPAAGFPARGMEGDSYAIAGNTLTVNMAVSQPGDWIRVITAGVPPDTDNDGVPDVDDNCPNTVIVDVPSMSLGVNRFSDVDGDGIFDTTSPEGTGPDRSYTIADTTGCSCTQIIEAQGLGNGHNKFGCSISAMDDWVELVRVDEGVCTAAISATTLRYMGPDKANATVTFQGKDHGFAQYAGVDLLSGVTVLTMAGQNGFTIDGNLTGDQLGSRTTITIDGVEEIIHTSCSAIYSAGQPAPLDANTPNPPNSVDGDPSPNWTVVNFLQRDGQFFEE